VGILQGLGLNMVRLGVMWAAVEPVQGQFNYTYLTQARALVDMLGANGIVTLVDMHQDLLSPETCGEGIPQWAMDLLITSRACNESVMEEGAHAVGGCKSIREYNLTIDPSTGYPTTESCLQHPFSMLYPTPEVSSAFQSLFTNVNGVQDAFVNFWSVVSGAFADSESVLGYDLINEPFVGDFWRANLLNEVLVPGHTDLTYLQPLYERVAAAIYQQDPTHLLFFEPTPLPDSLPFLGGIVSPVGFNSTPGATIGIPPHQCVLSWHYYSCIAAPSGVCDAQGNPLSSATEVCDKFVSSSFVHRMVDRTRLGGGAMLTEFGACTTGAECVAEITRVTNLADSNLQSWAYWQYKYFHDPTTQSGAAEGLFDPATGLLIADKTKALARTYAQVVQGMPISMQFDPLTAAFNLTYTTVANATAPSMIFAPVIYYPNGLLLALTPATLEYSRHGDRLAPKLASSIMLPFACDASHRPLNRNI
jgi:endoglycosylceramidase